MAVSMRYWPRERSPDVFRLIDQGKLSKNKRAAGKRQSELRHEAISQPWLKKLFLSRSSSLIMLELVPARGASMKQQSALGIVVLLLGTPAAFGSSASVGPLTCWTAYGTIEMQDCTARSSIDGGAFGRCTIITTEPDGRRIVTKLDGTMKLWGGTHPIHKAERSLKIKYDRGKFFCSFTPSSDYSVGDCIVGSAGGSCTVLKASNGSNQYFKASASARPDWLNHQARTKMVMPYHWENGCLTRGSVGVDVSLDPLAGAMSNRFLPGRRHSAF
jgi:hypothetical protein